MAILGLEVWHIVLIAATALVTQTIGGLAGYGTGMLMPLVLVPLIGPEAIVPVISLSALITNPTRVWIFRQHLDWGKALLIGAVAVPTTMLGAWSYTLLSGSGAALIIGSGLVLMVPLRRYLATHRFRLGTAGAATGGVIYGFLNGGMTGTGVLLIEMMMAMGLTGLPVIATDALASTIVGLAKTGVFAAAGELPPKLCLVAVLIGAMATPGTLIARWLAGRLPVKLHETMIEAMIIVGGLVLIGRAIAGP